MIRHRLLSLRIPASAAALFSTGCLFLLLNTRAAIAAVIDDSAEPAQAQQQPAPPPQQPQSPTQPSQQNPPAPAPSQNPFENVPTAPEKPSQANNPSNIQEAKPASVGENIIEGVEFRGQHKVPQDTLRALIYTKKGDVFDEEAVHRDFISLWNTGRFDDLRIEREKGPNGGILLRFVVVERRTVHTIDYSGNKSISKSEILDRFKERKVNLTPESQYDPG